MVYKTKETNVPEEALKKGSLSGQGMLSKKFPIAIAIAIAIAITRDRTAHHHHHLVIVFALCVGERWMLGIMPWCFHEPFGTRRQKKSF